MDNNFDDDDDDDDDDLEDDDDDDQLYFPRATLYSKILMNSCPSNKQKYIYV